MRFLMKFGGTSVADAQCIKRVVDILEGYHKAGDEVAVVVSAQRGVTDQLIALAEKLPTAKDCSEVPPLIAHLRERHMATLRGAAPDYVREVEEIIENASQASSIFFLRSITSENLLPDRKITLFHTGSGCLLR
jgi:aspartate kinase